MPDLENNGYWRNYLNQFGEMPEMPPPVGSEEREAWKENLGEEEAIRRMKIWQKAIAGEEEWVNNQLLGTYGRGNITDQDEALASLGYQNIHEKGQSMYNRIAQRNSEAQAKGYKNALEMMAAEAFQKGGKKFFDYDPNTGSYVDTGALAAQDMSKWDWRDARGVKIAPDTNSSMYKSAMATLAGQSAAKYDYNPYNPFAASNSQQSTTPGQVGVTRASARTYSNAPQVRTQPRNTFGLQPDATGMQPAPINYAGSMIPTQTTRANNRGAWGWI